MIEQAARVTGIARFSLTTADALALADFYARAFGCVRMGADHLRGPQFASLMELEGGATRLALRLGDEIIELLQFEHPGRPYPKASTASDLIFQHFALVVPDMANAWQWLSQLTGWMPITRDCPQKLPPSSGGVTAFKFRDPEGHPLELLEFAADSTPDKWRGARRDGICLGIDHSAISVANTAVSIAFYDALGFRVKTQSVNHGPEQTKLDDVSGAQVQVTALQAENPAPHLELLCYEALPGRRPETLNNNDIAATRLVLNDRDGAFPRSLSDPDGHRLLISDGGPIAGDKNDA
jgi:catechol 2,3-dioxygenase-like lactoylglutathione lyase family enzyme